MKKVIKLTASVNTTEAIELFLQDCEDRNLAEGTLEYYSFNFTKFLKPFLDRQNTNITDMTTQDIKTFIRQQKKKVSIASVNIRLRAIRSLLNYLHRENYMPKVNIQLLKDIEKTIHTFDKDQILMLLKKPKIKIFADIRDWAIINFLLATGCRLSSVINVKVQDVDKHQILLTHTKNRCEQALPAGRNIHKVIQEYNTYRKGNQEEYLFCNVYGDQMKKRTVQDLVKKYCLNKLGKTNIRYSPHTFRHTFAVWYLRQGGDIFTLQKLLGHRTLEMTRKYVNLLPEDIKREYMQNNILDTLNVRQNRKTIKI